MPEIPRRFWKFAQLAQQRGADLAVFSELCLCGYLPLDLIERPQFLARNERELLYLAKKLPIPSIVGYAARATGSTGKAAANAAALLANGRIEFIQHKMLLPTYDVFDESRYFQPAAKQSVFSFGGQKLGITICEDIWNDKTFWAKPLYERDPVAELVAQHATFLINISASPYTIDKRSLRIDMLRSLAKTHGLPVLYVNQVGGNDSLVLMETASSFCPMDESWPRQVPSWKILSFLTRKPARANCATSLSTSLRWPFKPSFVARVTTCVNRVFAK